MQIGVQYYRPPFPNDRRWAADLANIRAAGLNTLQLWVLWSWVEAEPGKFEFGDYDRLVELAGRNNLKVVLSVIPEVQPLWIHRVIPGSELVNHLGDKVVSTNRVECHFGLSPGACFDHPAAWERMQAFIRAVVGRYKGAPNLHGWDAWNELRWNVHAQGLVCFCPHTLRLFREWLGEKYGGLDGLNRAWQRRYASWDDVMPGWSASRPFTEAMAFQHFLTVRANEHARKRHATIKEIDAEHPVTMHGGQPSPYYAGGQSITPLDRCNDWFLAEFLDGVGCSSFPNWQHEDLDSFVVRMETIRSAAGSKRLWLSELQGGRAASGFAGAIPVRAVDQQHWLWNGIATGADTVLFWCWRDEIFTTEAAGFGIVGNDGFAEERVAGFQNTAAIIQRNGKLLAKCRPRPAEVGVLFSPQSYYLHWCHAYQSNIAKSALVGYGKALAKRGIGFEVVEEEHLEKLEGLKVLFMPRATALDDKTADRLLAFAAGGGTLVVESECGAFDPAGIYRYPEERFLARIGARDIGRRMSGQDPIPVKIAAGGKTFRLTGVQWLTPWSVERGTAWAKGGGGMLAGEVAHGKGRVILLASYFGDQYLKQNYTAFEDFVGMLCETSGCRRGLEIKDGAGDVLVRECESAGSRVFFLFCKTARRDLVVSMTAEDKGPLMLEDLVSGARVTGKACGKKGGKLLFRFKIPKERMLILAED